MDRFATDILEKYECLRGVPVPKETQFWDAVVLTAVDEDQKAVYEIQLKYKYERKELPLNVPIFVIADPPGPKLGNGGSTFTALEFLYSKYGEKFYEIRVLLIHAGGQSQRMPSASVLGKIFSPIPRGRNSIYQMLDVKLAMYTPLIPKMGPGVFVVCADDFLVYNLGESHENLKFGETGFTALAHPSSLSVGTGHGVYVLENISEANSAAHVEICSCLRVLQKPSEALMYKAGAVLNGSDITFGEGLTVKGKAAYTDSSFFFAHDVTRMLLNFLKNEGPITCEIDAYGDFLQALGPDASSDYISNVSNVGTVTSNLLETRQKVFDTLKGTNITLFVMNSSKFIHIGTTKEYVEHFCCDIEFQTEMGLNRDVFNIWPQPSTVSSNGSGDINDDLVPAKIPRFSCTSQGCVMHSALPTNSDIARTAVLEYCNFDVPVAVGQNCILSNCEYIANHSKTEGTTNGDETVHTSLKSLNIPNHLFLHTIPVFADGATKYVTVFFHINDNLKKVATEEKPGSLPFLGKWVEDYATFTSPKLNEVFSNKTPKINLWFAQLFPLCDSMSQSLALALQCIEAVQTEDKTLVSLDGRILVSMATVLKNKDLDTMLKQRNDLYNKIRTSI